MTQLSPAGQQLVQSLSGKYGVSTDAITHMLIAVRNGNGSMAQFNHGEFGGSGQWMLGGMTMVSDLFNYQLKSLVDNVCSEISSHLANHQSEPFAASFQSQSQSGNESQTQTAGGSHGGNSLFVPDPQTLWWPSHLGSPSATGAQNHVKYAYFASTNRLAVATGNDVWVYDTGNHQIGGFGQQQGGGASITFTSQFGTVDLSTLPVVEQNGAVVEPAAAQNDPVETAKAPLPQPTAPDPPPVADLGASSAEQDILATIEKLGGLMEKGFLSREEFDAKKADLLDRL